jgi:hypothetical protein
VYCSRFPSATVGCFGPSATVSRRVAAAGVRLSG